MCVCVGGGGGEISGVTVCSFQLTMHRECRHHSSCSESAPWGCIVDGSETHMFHTCGWQGTRDMNSELIGSITYSTVHQLRLGRK